MQYNAKNPRPLAPGMGEAVARRTVYRRFNFNNTPYTEKDHKTNAPHKWETWGQVAERVAAGNISIVSKNAKGKIKKALDKERDLLNDHIANGSILMSGRHLQHGDITQPGRPQEVFTNCSTAATSFMKFYLLLNGSGVGRCYDDDLMVIDWSKQPFIHVCLDETHPDYDYTCMESLQQVQHKYGKYGVTVFPVQDSREGWAKALEHLEALIFEGGHENDIVVYDFSKVRPRGSWIGGMQGRPSSGPVPTMNMFNYIKSLKGCKKPLWWQNMYVDHYSAESVLVGGARRAARICVKHWRDPDILEYINIKKPWTIPEVKDKEGNVIRKSRKVTPLWSANNSVGVDREFWDEHNVVGTWAHTVFEAICAAAYYHGTGEPGLVNLDKLNVRREGLTVNHLGSSRYEMTNGYKICKRVFEITMTKKHIMIVNPCGEIPLIIFGGYCVIGDIAPFHCETLEEFYEAVRLVVRALMRTNLMDCVYRSEVKRTNRIGISLTGIHEFAWKFFKLNFHDLTDEIRGIAFWKCLGHASRVAIEAAKQYAEELGVEVPHSVLTIKPAGTTSKLFGLTEGAHLPSMREYIRWVQFRTDDPLVKKYQDLGYKIKKLKQYEGTTVVGFPTQPTICTIGMDTIVTATEATMKQQYMWLMLLEKHWLHGGQRHYLGLESHNYGNQVSYTLKYDPSTVSFNEYKTTFAHYQASIKCCSVMPTFSTMEEAEYEYLPEEPVDTKTFHEYVKTIKQEIEEDVDKVHLDCSTGACPVDFQK